MKYVALKPCVSVIDDASRDVIQTPQTFRGISVSRHRPPKKPIFYPTYINKTLNCHNCCRTVGCVQFKKENPHEARHKLFKISLQLGVADAAARSASVPRQMGFDFTPLQHGLDSSSPAARVKATRVSSVRGL